MKKTAPKPTTGKTVLAIVRVDGQWQAIVPLTRPEPGCPTIATINPREGLTSKQARTFDRWVDCLDN